MGNCPVCNKPPQSVGVENDPGVSPCLSRCDHVHKLIIKSADGSVVATYEGDGVWDLLGAPPPMAKMAISLDRTAAQGTGNEDVVCIDDATGLAFTPRWIHAKLHRNGGLDTGGSTGDGVLTDGNNIGRQQTTYVRDTTTLAYDNRAYLGVGVDGGIVGFLLAIANSGAAGTVRLAWTIVNGGATVEGLAIIYGDLP